MSDSLNTGHRWASVTPDDRSGILYIVTFLSFIYTSLAFATRLIVEWHILGLDDGAMLVAQILLLLCAIVNVIQFGLLLNSLSNGLAKSFNTLKDHEYSRMAATYSAGQTATYISLGVSKLATILLVRRLFIRNMRMAWTTCNSVVGAMFIWTVASAVLVSAGCSAEDFSPKISSQMYSGIETRYKIVVVTDAITDFLLAVVPAYLCRHIQMNFAFKLQVLGIFALRLALLALASFFFTYWSKSLKSDRIGVARTPGLIFQQSQLCVSLIAGTVPCLKSFIQSFDTGSGMKAVLGHSINASKYGQLSNMYHNSRAEVNESEGYQMSLLNHRERIAPKSQAGVDNGDTVRVDGVLFATRLCSVNEKDGVDIERHSTHESDRQSQVIRRDIQWEIMRETARRDSDIKISGLLRLSR